MPATDSPPRNTHPVTRAMRAQRAASVQLKVADQITAFAGSMPFVYLHAAVFAVWMLAFEGSPWPTLTLILVFASSPARSLGRCVRSQIRIP